jgi:hypothetical protein
MDKWNWKILKDRSIELTFFKVYKYGCKKMKNQGGWMVEEEKFMV